MKKLIAIFLCVFVLICTWSATAVFAEETPDDEPEVEVIEITDADATVSDADSYTLTDEGEPVLEVVHIQAPGMTAALDNVAQNGYYTAEFIIPETNYKVFLTGLTQENVDGIRMAIVDSFVEGEDFDLYNLGFIDAEKTWADDGDDNMCWAATSSNLLTYTGWAKKAGFNSTDDLFETFINSFTNDGGNIYYGAGWFFNGLAGDGGAQPTSGTGRYLPQYSFGDLVQNFEIYENCAEKLKTIYDRLHDGYGVGLSVDIYGSQGYESSHAISCWGFVTDIRYPDTAKLRYKSVFVTDSDSDKYWVKDGKDRRDADDVMSLYALNSVDQEGFDTYRFQITPEQTAFITDASTLVPYSADIAFETDPTASMDVTADFDISIDPFYLTAASDGRDTTTVFSPDDTIYYQPRMKNTSKLTYTDRYHAVITLKDAQGNVKHVKTISYGRYDLPSEYHAGFGNASLGKLPVGDYTITAEFNPNRTVTEAYYYNNIKTIDFKVREKYLLGDVDNNNDVNIVDATVLQRIIAKMPIPVSVDENTVQRGDVSHSGYLDTLDATIVQRHFANIDVLFDINVVRFYD